MPFVHFAPARLPRAGAVLVVAALVVSLLPLAQPVQAQEAFTVEIAPAIGENRAVRGGQEITVSGQAPAGTIESATLIAVEVDGDELREPVAQSKLNRTPSPILDEDDYLRVSSDGSLEGRLTLGCIFASPTSGCMHDEVRSAALEVTVAGETADSNPLRVDYTRPQLRPDRELIAPDRVLVRFTEPVRQPHGELGADWRVNGSSAAAVEVSSGSRPDCVYEPGEDATAGDTGCTRILHLAESLHEDATPDVEYWLIGSNVPERSEHFDYASNQVLFRSTAPRIAAALDLIRPAKPNIESVDGHTPTDGEVRGNDPDPIVRLTNLTAGHTAQITVAGPDGTSTHEEVVPAGANAVDVPIPTLPGDGSYTFTAVAIDPHDNTSEDDDKTGPRADGARQTVRYVVDSVAPRPLAATLLTRRSVEVVFTEAIMPSGDAGSWFVGDTPVDAEGSDERRTLRSATDLTAPADGDWLVRWEPTAESSEPGTNGRYGDRSGNGVAAFQLPLSDLPAVPAPGVTTPAGELFTNADTVTVSGTAPNQDDLVAELFERGDDEPRSSSAVADGRWSIDEELASDRRYEFDVRLRDTQTENPSQRVAVPDIIRDTTDPEVDVMFPDPRPLSLDNPTEQRRAYGVGSSVPIRWRATDDAPDDPERDDHGDFATITMVNEDGTRRVIADNIPHQPGQEQTHSYTLTQADLAGQGSHELEFEVAVTDLATNRGARTSSPILLLADLIGYQPVLVQPGVIEARFPVPVSGETVPGEWLVDGQPAQQIQKTSRDGVTVVRLTSLQNDDPNWTPAVRYQPLAINPSRLQGDSGAPVSTEDHQTVDAIAPALSAAASVGGDRPVDIDVVTFSGTTDTTSTPNTVFAYLTDATGAVQGSAIASTTAGTDGEWEMDVPVPQNRTSHLVVRASDPSGNVSDRLPDPPVKVVEDSLAPVVQIISPQTAALVAPVFDITWETVEANKESVRIDYRIGAESWQPIADRIDDTGTYRWEIPEHVLPEIFSLRVTATDQTAKTGTATVDGLRLDLEAPTVVKARASGAQVVDVTFSEPVTLDDTSGFTVGGATVRRVKGDGLKRTFILNSAVDSTTPELAYDGDGIADEAGNTLETSDVRATRSFAFAVKNLRGQRVTANNARVTWTDDRNRRADLRGYRVYRDGAPIALVGASTRAFTDRDGKGRHVYTVRAVDDRRRVSSVRRVVVRR